MQARFPSPEKTIVRALCALLVLAAPVAGAADTAEKMHDALKERWYTTELIVFRTTSSSPGSAGEATLLEGEKLSVAQERERLGVAPEALETEADADEDGQLDGLAAPQPQTRSTVKILTDSAAGVDADALKLKAAQTERPKLDAEPWGTIKDYDAADDLAELVARNMATWETQLRSREGEWLTPEELTLGDAASRLARRRNVEVLLHSGWTQAVPDRESGQPIEIANDDTYLNPVTQEIESRLSGTVTVTLGRYLHVQPTLFYTPEYSGPEFSSQESSKRTGSSDEGNSAQIVARARAAAAAARGESPSVPATQSGPRVPDVRDLSSGADNPNKSRRSALDRLRDASNDAFRRADTTDFSAASDLETERPPYIRLDESRRVRSGELHYLDHPELGVLVRITPVVAQALLQEQFALLQ